MIWIGITYLLSMAIILRAFEAAPIWDDFDDA